MSAGSIAEHGREGRAGRPWRGLERTATPAAIVVGVLVLLGGGLRFYGLGHQGFWYDEANTAMLMRHPAGEMLGLLPTNESTPPLYYCVAWVWTRILGSGEAGLRSLSALFGVLLIPVAYALGRTAVSRRVGLVLAALVTFNPLLIWYSQEARSYALLALLSAVTLLATVRALRTPDPRALAVWSVSAILALTTHYFAVLVVAPEALWLLIAHGRRRATLLASAVVAASGLALIPLALSQNGTHRDRWISRSPLGIRLNQVVPQMLIGPGSPDRLLVKFVAFAAAAVALGLLLFRGTGGERRIAVRIGALLLFGFGLNFLFILAGYDDLITRNLLALEAPLLIVLAIGFGARRAGWLGLLAAAVLCATGITAAVGVAADYSLQRPDWRPLAHLLGPAPPRHGPGRAFLIQRYRMLLPLSLYMPGLRRIAPVTGAIVNQFDVISISAPEQRLCWWGAACNLFPSRPQRSYRIPGFHFVWRRRVRQFTVEHFVSRHPVRIRSATVFPALHTTQLGHDDLLFQQ
ncbi:MAG TPA: glycosyltransferase family 39 protein [Solirubrobacteraceae bacterium]